MSAVEDDFERALWNNHFYSSATVLTESSSSNHLSNLKKQANISNSVSMQSLSDHVKSPNAGTLRSEKYDKSKVPTSSIQASRTSLMKLSPSIKALEKVLNLDSTTVKMPPVIAEEEEEEEEEERGINGYANASDLKYRGMYENSNHSDPESKGFNGVQLNHPRASYSSFSLSTLHTAKSTVALENNGELQGLGGTSQVSATTQVSPGGVEAEDETIPKLLPSAHITSSQLLRNQGNDSGMDISIETFENNEAFENERLVSRRHLESPSIKTMISSKSCPSLSEKTRLSEALLMDEDIASYPETLAEPIDLHSSSRKDRNIQSSAESDKVSAITSKVQRPVRSLLDSPFLGQPETSLKLQKPMSPVNNEGHFVPREHTKMSSKSNAPLSSARSSHLETKSDARVPKSPSFFSSHKRVPSQDVSDMSRGVGSRKNSTQDMQGSPVSVQANVSIHKRFSFRGLFKVKSKHPPPVKPKVAQDDSQKPSVPVKLSAKSFSTPNMSGLAHDAKTQTIPENDVGVLSVHPRHDNKSNLFKRRGSTSTISHIEADPHIKIQKSGTALTASTVSSGITTGTAPIGKAIAPSRKKPPVDNSPTMLKPQMASPPIPPPKRKVFETFTKPTTPHKRETIREVDDTDYSPNITCNQSIQQTPKKSAPTDGESTSRIDDADDIIEQYSPFNSGNFFTTQSNSSPLFGSPFRVTFPTERFETNSPRVHTAFKLEPPQSSDRSVVSKGSSEQLAGETVFPKSLDAAEIESIVSLERSRSMRSIRSNKRSSFMNYNGSDENIVLAKNLVTVIVTQGSMKRSGSILKNSPSTQSLLSETYPSIEAKFVEAPDENFAISDILADPEAVRSPGGDDDLVNFIEFSDYIDFDNLNFSPSPLPNTFNYGTPAYSFSGIYVEDEIETAPGSSQCGKGNVETHFEGPLDTSELASISETVSDAETSTAIDTAASVIQSKSMAAAAAKNFVSPPEKFPPRFHSLPFKNHEVVFVTSRTSSEFDTSRAVSEGINADISQASFDKPCDVSFENPGTASPIEKTFKFATDDDSQESMARPVSMSFKGFHGSAFKNRVMPQSGSHQSINFDEESTNEESVGRGFGSSEEDSDDNCESFEVQENDEHFHIAAHKPQSSSQEPKKMNNFDRRQQHIKNVLDLQPPPASLKLRHNRIPSLSDQSSISSPKSLTSFISRMRKSPMPSPKMPPQTPRVKFSSRIILYDTYHHDEYDRHPEIATCNQLTPQLAQQIKQELNKLKAHMEVHQDSACYTQFF